MHEILQPEGWAKPIGYSNAVMTRGRTIHLAGLVGWNAKGEFESEDLVAQIRQILLNIKAVLAAGGAGPEHLTSMTWYLLDKREYNARLKEIGAVYREVIGRSFPAMAAVQVAGLVEDGAKVEIQSIAVIPDETV